MSQQARSNTIAILQGCVSPCVLRHTYI